jgi:CBS domain-containing protein
MSQEQTVRDAMNDSPQTVGRDTSVRDAARAMRDADVSILAVVDDDDALIGVITDRDIAILVVAEEADPTTATVGETMSAPISVDQGDNLDEAFRRMLEENVHRAPVTDDDRHVAGMISQADAAHEGEGRSVGGSSSG